MTRYATEMGRRLRLYLLFQGRDRWCKDLEEEEVLQC